jgi:hypothetical protein
MESYRDLLGEDPSDQVRQILGVLLRCGEACSSSAVEPGRVQLE